MRPVICTPGWSARLAHSLPQNSDPRSLKGFGKSQCSEPLIRVSRSLCLPALFSQGFDPLNFWNMFTSLRAIPETVFIKEITMISRHGTSYFPSSTRTNTQPPALTFSFRSAVWIRRLWQGSNSQPNPLSPFFASPLTVCTIAALRSPFWLWMMKACLEKLFAERGPWRWHVFHLAIRLSYELLISLPYMVPQGRPLVTLPSFVCTARSSVHVRLFSAASKNTLSCRVVSYQMGFIPPRNFCICVTWS